MARTMTRRPNRQHDEDETTRDEDEAPRGRRGASRSSRDEDDAPRGRRSRDEDEAPRGRRSRDEEDEKPARRSGNVGKGWGAYKKQREERSDFVKNYTLSDQGASLIKMLDDEPFAVYAEHWLDELKGKKSFTCLDDGCPLCDIGDKPRVYAMFNILDLADPENPVVKPWKVSQTVTDILEGYSTDEKTGPLNRVDIYFAVHKTGGGKKGRVQTHINPVKARDVEEDWDCVPFTEDELDDFDLLTEEDVIFFNSRKELQEIADDLD